MKTFGERLKALRKEKCVSQPELAQALGVSKAIISLWECNLREPLASNVALTARYFGVSADYLLGLED